MQVLRPVEGQSVQAQRRPIRVSDRGKDCPKSGSLPLGEFRRDMCRLVVPEGLFIEEHLWD